MANMLGLKYTGNREEGVGVMLFRSYKTVTITKHKPYAFTTRDNTSDEAYNYYVTQLTKLGVRIITDPAELSPASKVKTRQEPLAAEVDKQVDVQVPIPEAQPVSEDEPKSDPKDPAPAPEAENEPESTEVGQSSSDADSSQVSEMSDAELSEYLDLNFDRDGIKNLISAIGANITIGRRGTDALIKDLVSGYKDAVINHISQQ